MTTIEKIEKLEQSFLKELASLKDEVRAKETTALEVGKWYHATHDGDIYRWVFLFDYQNGSQLHYKMSIRVKGNSCEPEYEENDWLTSSHEIRPATEQEVFEALKKEAERRGFKAGVKIKWPGGNDGVLDSYDWRYSLSSDNLCFKSACGPRWIYHKGTWAEIIKDESLKIAGHEVKYYGGYVSIDGKNFTLADVKAAKTVLANSEVEFIKVGCSTVRMKEVDLILNNWK